MMIAIALLTGTAGLAVELKPEAHARGTELVVAEIARVTGPDPELVERALALGVGHTPAPGFSRRLDRWALERELAQAFPGVDVSFTGSEACRVVPDTETIRGDELLGVARTELAAAFAMGDVTYESETETGDVVIPTGRVGHELRARLEHRPQQSGLVAVPVEVLIDGDLYRTVYTSWRVEAWREAPVLVRDVSVGEELTRALFRRERVRVGIGPAQAYLTEAAAEGSTAVRGLRAGKVVSSRDVRRPLFVRRGDTVQLQVRKGNITATSTAVAADDGFLGDKIRVVSAGQRELRAVILGRDLVSIDLRSNR